MPSIVEQRLSIALGAMSALHGAETVDAVVSDAVQQAKQARAVQCEGWGLMKS